MKIGKMLLCGLLLAMSGARAADQASLERAPAAQALPALTQRLYDALAPGERAPWLRYLSDRFVQTDESGARVDKKQLMDAFGPLPSGLSGTIAIKDPQVSDFGSYAFIRYDLDEHEQVFDQQLHVLYRSTDAWRREHGRWRMISSQVMVLAQDPRPLPANPAVLADYVGSYSLSGQWRYRVERAAAGLAYGRDGHPAKPMIAVADNVFVVQGDPLAIQYVFERGADGRVQRLVERRKFADLELRRLPDAAPP
jgi:hypothetical protein